MGLPGQTHTTVPPAKPCRGFDSPCRLWCDVSRHPGRPEPALGVGPLSFSGWRAGWLSGAVVAAGGVEGEVAVELTGGGVDDADVDVGDEQDDAGSGEAAAEGDVVELTVVAQGDRAAVGDAVVADAVVGVGAPVGRGGFGAGGVGHGGGAALG